MTNKNFYSIYKAEEFYKDSEYIPKKEFLIVRINNENETFNPVKQVNSIQEGKKYIKFKQGKFIDYETKEIENNYIFATAS